MKYPDIFNPDLSRIGVQESQMYNMVAGELVTRTVKTALGPRGMTKVYVDILGEDTVTVHGGAFLRKIDVDHPAAKAVVDAVNTVDNHVGDGTTTAAVLIGALLKNAREMRALRIPTASIIAGYEAGLVAALAELERIKFEGRASDRRTVHDLARCCIRGKALGDLCEGSRVRDGRGDGGNGGGSDIDNGGIVDMLVRAAYCTSDVSSRRALTDDVKIEEKPGNTAQTELVMGTVIDKPVDSAAMPRAVRDARILLVSEPLERSRTKTESEIAVDSPGQMGEFLRQESDDVCGVVSGVIGSGANVVISRKGIDDEAQELLARSGIISVRRVKHNDIWWLEKATGAVTCTDIRDMSSAKMGHASLVCERNVGGDRMLFVESGRDNVKSVTLLLRANSKRYLDEFHRTALNVLHVLRDFIECPYLVYGAGSCEAILARRVRDESDAMTGKVQVAAARFADALESVTMTLAENVGIEPLDALPLLRSKVYDDHRGSRAATTRICDNAGGAGGGNNNGAATGLPSGWYGVDHASRSICDVSCLPYSVIEPYAVKAQVLKSSVEAACAVLNVDDVFVKDLIDNTHCHIDGTVHAHKDPGRNHNHWEQEGLEQRQMHHYY
ncbi:MAG: hypothetical protein J4F28_00690 [Nitrosopumilaceae archaeon]|nr:hypothetical protein [Nitrosopumilaceae archaeon]